MNRSIQENLALVLILRRRSQRKQYRRRYWVHPLNLLRPTMGEHLKIELMYSKYPEKFFQYRRMTSVQFDKLFLLTESHITKSQTNYREPICPRIRLFVTLRYLSTGDSIATIATGFSLGDSIVRSILWETTRVIWDVLSPIYLKCPDEAKWNEIVEGFETEWNFPNCLGAIDGKHVMIQAPGDSGSLHFNYKGFFSTVLLATCDAKYLFTTVNIGACGRQSDGGIFAKSSLGMKLEDGSLPIPGDKIIQYSGLQQPCTFVGDDAFALTTYMMRPYSGKTAPGSKKRVFNYRLSRARRVIENVFGIVVNRFRIYRRCIIASAGHVNHIIQVTVVLHNFLMLEDEKLVPENRKYCPPGYVDQDDAENGEWRIDGTVLDSVSSYRVSNNYTKNSKFMRDDLAEYFYTTGSVPWQNERAV